MKTLQAANYGGLHYDSETDKWYMDDNSYHALQQFAPPLNTLRRLIPDEKSKQDNLITAYVSFITGTGFRQITEANKKSEQISRFFEQKDQFDRQADLNKAIAKERQRQGQ
jgi:mannose-6-phosphate isomerase class I